MSTNDDFKNSADLVSFNRRREDTEMALLRDTIGKNSKLMERLAVVGGMSGPGYTFGVQWIKRGGVNQNSPAEYISPSHGVVVTATHGQHKSTLEIMLGVDGKYKLTRAADGARSGDVTETTLNNKVFNALNQFVTDFGNENGLDVLDAMRRQVDVIERQAAAAAARARSPK